MTNAEFREETADSHVEEVALSHLSLELGHLYMDDYLAGMDRLVAQFLGVAPWAEVARSVTAANSGTGRPRISTCFLIDDYFTQFSSPAKVLPDVLAAAEAAGLTIDYIARESACVVADGVPLAEIVAGRLTARPPRGANGRRPPTVEVGWLCNGQRSPGVDASEAMANPHWLPPEETEATNHSIFLDVELWSDEHGKRTWSCAFLASVWQLVRLGMIRNSGRNVVTPVPMSADFPDEWKDLPPVVRVADTASPFCAYRTQSVLPRRFLNVEHAVQVIVGQYSALPAVIDQIASRIGRERLELPADLTERIDHVFFNGG
ncbi:MAG: SCO2522 family protein [Actinophytocola sp.]|uniref:SCO2522 family protein n=1 Tax=Actinophytocola sp. TaxID=1872138 RepID=UPI003C7350B0